MLGLCIVTALSAALVRCVIADRGGCLPLPINHFHWLNPDGSLVNPRDSYFNGVLHKGGESQYCCGPLCIGKWRPVPGSPSCKFCPNNNTLICQDSSIYNVPNPVMLPTNNLTLYKLSGFGLNSLLPKSFKGLSIKNLVIENTLLYYLEPETFSEVKFIESLYLKNNMLFFISQADKLFWNINNLKFLSLEDGRLKGLSSTGIADMHNLTYFSLADSPLNTLDVSFLQNSGLIFFDLRNTTFKLKKYNIKYSGLSRLPSSLNTIDLSRASISHWTLENVLEQLKGKSIITLNLSYLRHHFYSFSTLRFVKDSLQYISLKGTNLNHIFSTKRDESHVSRLIKFVNMKGLNLENCNISYFVAREIFRSFPNLSTLSLAGNSFYILDLNIFFNLPKLVFADLSNNVISDILFDTVQSYVNSLQGVDLSNTNINLTLEKSEIFVFTLENVQMLSLCNCTLSLDVAYSLSSINNLNYLDLSASFSYPELGQAFNELFSSNNLSLTELHFSQNNFKSTSDPSISYSQLISLEILDLSNNLLLQLPDDIFVPTLKNLNVSQNLITTWYTSILNNQSQLRYLDISGNQITYVSDAMIEDFYKLESISLDNNPIICHNKVVALVCSSIRNATQNFTEEAQGIINFSEQEIQSDSKSTNNSHALTVVDWKHYKCYDVLFKGFRQFLKENDCNEYYEEVSTTHQPLNPTTQSDAQKTTKSIQPYYSRNSTWNWEWTYIIVGPIIMVTVVGSIIHLKWWNIRCFFHHYISLRRASLLRKNGNFSSRPEIYYDVFVSYSDVDRAWVLDYLVPNMERDGDVSLCFHERDFQVGMSILENIIDCMDRSHALLLVVSSAFIFSKWCQFEMHLAQSRMIETFRDQLVLVLLEDIPRKARPQTLHHLMMTKTYLMWPQQPCKEDAYELFWRRLKRALRPNPNYSFTP